MAVSAHVAGDLKAVDRYLRVRVRHQLANRPELWLGRRGPLTYSGLRQMLNRRSREAGIPEVNPHQFRHTFAHSSSVQAVLRRT